MVAPAIQLFSDDHHIGLVGVRFPVELRAEGFTPEQPSTWPTLEGRLEFVGGRLLYMPPCADYPQDVAMDVAFVLRSWSETHPEFVVGGNEAGMKLGGDVRAADVAVWRADTALPRSGRVRSVPPVPAVEVSGEDEAEPVLRDKARWYLQHGVSVVWLVFPDAREVLVLTAQDEERFGLGQALPADEHLPNLEPTVAQFFTQLDRGVETSG
ncbi:MAG TPA: Uma2 family endonuclease [Polyangiaceae bacterium]|nr:Uma2 family endonuclease [Polyangiaceae bacterium]